MRACLIAFLLAAKLFEVTEEYGLKTSGSRIIGEYVSKNATTGKSVVKTYYLATMFKVDWMTAYVFCKDNDMTLVTLADKTEMENLIKTCNNKFKDFTFVQDFYLGGFTTARVTASKTEWFWFETGEKINFDIPWRMDTNQPDNWYDGEKCMSISNLNWEQNTSPSKSVGFYFNDVQCYSRNLSFVCQDAKPL